MFAMEICAILLDSLLEVDKITSNRSLASRSSLATRDLLVATMSERYALSFLLTFNFKVLLARSKLFLGGFFIRDLQIGSSIDDGIKEFSQRVVFIDT